MKRKLSRNRDRNLLIPNRDISFYGRRIDDDVRFEVTTEGGVPTMFIYDEIGWFGVEAQDIVRALAKYDADQNVLVRINSPGGDVFDGTAIINAFRQHSASFQMQVDGVAASMASLIALEGDGPPIMMPGTYYMIHEPWSGVRGSARDMRAEADLLDKIMNEGAKVYASVMGISEEKAVELMYEETWWTASEASEEGWANLGEVAAKASVFQLYDFSVFDRPPEELPLGLAPSQREADGTSRALESALREAGLSRADAKGVLAKGIAALNEADTDQREAEGEVLSKIDSIINSMKT